MAPLGNAMPPTPEPVPFKRSPAHDLWTVSIARIHEVCPLVFPLCGGQMRRIAFITHSADIRHLLNRIGVDCAPPRCGMRATRRWARVSKLRQTGPLIGRGRHNPQPTMRSTNASTGAVAKRRFRLAADRCCVRACPQAILRPKAWPFKWFDKSGNRRWWVL